MRNTLMTCGNWRFKDARDRLPARENEWTSGSTMVLLIIASWIVAAHVIDRRREFPLNNVWASGASVKTLFGGITLSGWASAKMVAQIFWGALFCLPFGFSFTALRISTLTFWL